MKKDALGVTGINFLATVIRPLSLSMSPEIQIWIQQILLTITSMLWMNLAFCQPIIKVIASADSLTVIKQVAQCLEFLDIRENVRLSIIFPATMPKNYAGFTTCVNGADLKKDIGYLIIKVYLDARQPKSLQRIVLAHEMIHVKQYAKRELIIKSKQEAIWKGQKYFAHEADDSHTPPWEREAYRNDDRLVKHCKERTEMLLQVLKTDAYVDHDLNQKKISDFQ
jgi:hypothetical protein